MSERGSRGRRLCGARLTGTNGLKSLMKNGGT